MNMMNCLKKGLVLCLLVGVIFASGMKKDSDAINKLCRACLNDNKEQVAKIISKNPHLDINACSTQDTNNGTGFVGAGRTPLMVAIFRQAEGIVNLLLAQPTIDVNKKCGQKKEDALYSSMMWGNLNIVESLLKKGANVNSQNVHGNTPLHIARAECIPCLVSWGANVQIRNQFDYTPLYFHANRDDHDRIFALLKTGICIDYEQSSVEKMVIDAARQSEKGKKLLEDILVQGELSKEKKEQVPSLVDLCFIVVQNTEMMNMQQYPGFEGLKKRYMQVLAQTKTLPQAIAYFKDCLKNIPNYDPSYIDQYRGEEWENNRKKRFKLYKKVDFDKTIKKSDYKDIAIVAEEIYFVLKRNMYVSDRLRAAIPEYKAWDNEKSKQAIQKKEENLAIKK
ncbi:MAG TPA: ankyrin repeat domain-containing protein [Candidatus Bathyarchaeia archaeon]|nr:ankyrin repeat domain-containing protein [Candidatus Bathyarchaeia archaeon]